MLCLTRCSKEIFHCKMLVCVISFQATLFNSHQVINSLKLGLSLLYQTSNEIRTGNQDYCDS